MTEVLSIEVTFDLPDWFAPTESMTWNFASESLERDSPDERALFEAFPEMTETCVDPQGKWVKLAIPVGLDTDWLIEDARLRLDAFLRKIKDDR